MQNLAELKNKAHGSMKGMAVSSLQGLALTIVVLVVIVSVGAMILAEMQDTQTVNSTAYNVSGAGVSAMDTFSDWFDIIIIIGIAVVIIGLLLYAFSQYGGRSA